MCIDRPIIRHLYFVICFEVTGGVQVHKKSNVWVEGKIYFHIYFGNLIEQQGDSSRLTNMGYWLKNMMN